jgi:hypothetical protein
MPRPPSGQREKRKHHNTCGKKCSRNKGIKSWPLMPDNLTPRQARWWYENKYS